MNPVVQKVEPLADYKLRLHFADGVVKIFDAAPFLDKGIFTQLKDVDYFKTVRTAFGAVQWPNEQDFSKDTLYLLGMPEQVVRNP